MTYNERLNEIAEELSEALYTAAMGKNDPPYKDFKEDKPDEHKEAFDALVLPLAAIALKHMAEEFRRGYDYKYDGSDYEDLEERLITNGLIEPQTEKI